ncbi:DUF177 domain-containing protein [Conexibacter sp. CPCC 206217]|uniref:YceD family protein n=1 Tax=Conexibacter sp. CPCC 206217 TaxID=3064574 RepID=UPI0027248D34|nr:DUF177 domain-containing protein [Conexibacter sp. CPCC 206217]MDO8212785.1 DUF177 domain-containing protein [Conexibacter sp. CPCC 206217]
MSQSAETFDLGPLRLSSGEGRSIDLDVAVQEFELSSQTYAVTPPIVPVRLDVSRTTANGYALRIRFEATLDGPCMRCLEPSSNSFRVDAREVEQPGARDEELDSPYVTDEVIDLTGWVRDSLSLNLPAQLLCRDDCAGLCAVCGENLNEQPDHAHAPEPDPRWAKLRELEL